MNRHHLCLHLPHWPADRLCRRRPELRHKAIALVHTAGNRQTVMHLSRHAPADLYCGMSLAEARARHADLLDFPTTPDTDARALEALGRWLMRFSPAVCIAGADGIFLEVTGVERLFGSVDELARRALEALDRLHIHATAAVAPTPGAAWALAAFAAPGAFGAARPAEARPAGAPLKMDVLHNSSDILAALAPLPPRALRLDDKTVRLLSALGIRTIGAMLRLPRKDLAVRFGPEILRRIDQASGRMPEPLVYLVHHEPLIAALEFESAIESLESIHLVVRTLLERLAAQLAERGLGARELRLVFHEPYAPPVHKHLQLMRPARDPQAMFKLLCCALEHLEAIEGFTRIEITAPVTQRLDAQQVSLLNAAEEEEAAELDHLLERLRARLNQDVQWGELIESHLPEMAWRATDTPPRSTDSARPSVDALRPLRLLRQPRPLKVIVRPSESRDGHPVSFTDAGRVHRLSHIRGPERLAGPWWQGRHKIRDYFDVLDTDGHRYWIFRVEQTRGWFLHGVYG